MLNPLMKHGDALFNKNVIPRAKLVDSNLKQIATDECVGHVRAEHLAILNCIKNKDGEGAINAMYNHLYHASHLYECYTRVTTSLI